MVYSSHLRFLWDSPWNNAEGCNKGMAEAAIADQLEEGAYATPLHFAVKENDVKKVRELLQEGGVKVTTRDIVGRTPLHWALVFGHDEAAKVLIVNTPRRALDARDERGCTPLHYAAARGHADVARVLVERGAAINGLDAKKRTPLHYAAQQVGPELVELLVSRGADKFLADVAGELPVSVAEKWGSSQSIACLRPDTITTTSEKVTLIPVFLPFINCIIVVHFSNRVVNFVVDLWCHVIGLWMHP